jgi:hypothetical protein
LKYLKGALVFNSTNDDDFLYCLPDNKEISVCQEIAKSIGFLKLEDGLSILSKDDLADSLADEDMDVFPSEIPPGLPPELPPDFRVSPTFNISDLKPYMGDKDEIESRTTPIQEEEDDEDITSIHTMNGPITRSRARQLNLQVRSTLVNCVSELTLGAMDVLIIRNLGEDQQGLGKGLGVEEEQQGRHNRKEIKSDSAATPSRVIGPVCTKMDAQDASGLRLRRT